MLTRMRLKNFKSWRDTGEAELRPITGIFGANSSGKTSLLQALLLLKQTAVSSDRSLVFHFGSRSTLVDLGSLRSVIHKHTAGKILDIKLEWKTIAPFKVIDSKSKKRTVAESCQLGFQTRAGSKGSSRRSSIMVNTMTYKVGDATFGMRKKQNSPGYGLFSSGANFRFAPAPGWPHELPAPVKCYGFPDQTRARFQNAGFVAELELQLEECLNRVYYLGPLRDYPKRRYIWTGAQPPDMGSAGESVVDAILAARERGDKISPGKRKRRRSLEQHLAHWLKELNLIHSFRVTPLAKGGPVFEVKVRRYADAPEALITDVGFGVSQILPVLALCFSVPEGSTVILEQPEIHLHPAVQAGLADVLIDAWHTRKVQILLESHSEHLLRRLQRRMAEEKISNNDIGLYFCQASDEKSKLTRLNLDQYGKIENWPEDFFGDEFGEIVATQRAEINRRREQSE